MATLVPGILLKLVQHMNTEVKVAGEHRSSLLQVISIVPALAGGDLFQNQGFYLKVSDSSHATYVALPDDHNDLIRSDKIQLGQYIHVERLEAASPVPILRGVRLIPGRHSCVGTPEEIVAAHSPGFLNGSSPGLKPSKSSKSAEKSLFDSKQKSVPSKLNNGRKDDKLDTRGLSITRSKSISNKSGGSLLERKESLGRLKISKSFQSTPSSPMSFYSLPPSFEKFSAEVKNQAKIKSDRGTPKLGLKSTKLGLVEKTDSRLSVIATPKKQPLISAPKKFAHVIDMGPKGLRRSWEGNMDTKSRDSLKAKTSKQDMISAVRSSVPKRNPADDRLSTKGENKVQTSSKSSKDVKDLKPARHSTGNVTLDDHDRSSKFRNFIGRRSMDSCNGFAGNLVKVPASNRRLVDASVLRTSLPSSLTDLGKEVLKLRDSAQMAAVEALQEACAAESILCCLSKYSELNLSAKEDDPQPAVEKFLALHSSLKSTLLITGSLSKTLSAGSSPESQEILSEETLRILSEKHKQAASWVNAAISTDLSSFSVYTDRPPTAGPLPPSLPLQNQKVNTRSQAVVILENSNKNSSQKTLAKPRLSVNSKVSSQGIQRRGIDPRDVLAVTQKTRGQPPPPPPPEWTRGNGLDEFVDLAKELQTKSEAWFLTFVERFLDADVDTSTLSDNCRIAGMLTQLKSVDDWLDEISGGTAKEDDHEEEEETARVPNETLDRLRKKIYEYLLMHVESAAAVLGSGPQTSKPARNMDMKGRR